MNQSESLGWLQDWYRSCCNGDWEHAYGVRLETLDNPGWWVEIDLTDTDFADMIFDPIKFEESSTNWYNVHVERIENEMPYEQRKEVIVVFKGSGGAGNLTDIVRIFREKCAEVGSYTTPTHL